MRMAVASDGLQASSHAARCSSYMFYTVKRGIITECQNLPNPGLPAAEMVELFQNLGIDALITNGIDMDFANMLCHSGIEVIAGVSGTAREVAEAYLNRTLIGATALCHVDSLEQAVANDNNGAYSEEDRTIDEAFERIERELLSAVH